METATLQAFLKVLSSSRGPFGRIQAIGVGENANHFVLTSSSRRLLDLLPLNDPYVRIIKSGTLGYLNHFHDGGLLVATLATKLVLAGLSLGIPRHVVISVYGHALSLCLEYLDTDVNAVVSIELSDTERVLNIVRSVLCSKPLCRMSPLALETLAILIVKAFFTTLPTHLVHFSPLERVRFLASLGEDSDKSELFDGVLLTTTQQSKQFIDILEKKKGSLTVAVFNVSLAGDVEDWPDELTVDLLGSSCSKDDTLLQCLMTCAGELVGLGVDIVFCQKCIHPRIKLHLGSKGVLSIDRVSIQHIEAVRTVCGAKLLATVHTPFPARCLGHLREVNYITRHEKCLLQLRSSLSDGQTSINTILLCASDEMSLDELKVTCEQSINTLGHIVRCPKVMTGGGWTERQLAGNLRHFNPADDTLKKLRTTKSQYQVIVEKFAQCLDAVARQLSPMEHMPGETLHLCDQLSEDKPRALDSYVVKVNTLSTATELANACLRVTNVIAQ